jgi:hypothetical protein
MTEDIDIPRLVEQYQKILKIFREHMRSCGSFERKVIEEFENE